ncbi:uncharacterized protein LOC128552973 [Mercenaria mercenaria]|uniref:uncharacterized protein LOC128552973 n=1 Tax=Mercenaria mercenaria TaxID=6596 RepID=UPI00234E4ECB|nr:uncharacterized protein LOC128552973 [Mercenaria mercenaria]
MLDGTILSLKHIPLIFKHTNIDFTFVHIHLKLFFIIRNMNVGLLYLLDRMENYCNDEFSFLWKSEYQVRLELNAYKIYETKGDNYPYDKVGYCVTTFEAWLTRYPKFMFYFEDLNLDCNKGHLEFYIGDFSDTRVKGLETDICGADKPQGVYTVDERYFRIKYFPKRSHYSSDIFSIIITTYGPEGTCPSYAHVCANSRCIDDNLVCNGNKSCGDNSGCELSTGAIVGIVIGSLVGLALLVSVVVWCIYSSIRSGNTFGPAQSTPVTYSGYTPQVCNQPMYGVNQGSPYNPRQSPYPLATAPSSATTDPSQQGIIRPVYDINEGTNYHNDQTHTLL